MTGIGGSRRARIFVTWPKKWAAKNAKDRFRYGQSTNLGGFRLKIRCETNSRRTEYGKLFGGKDPNCGLTSGFSTTTVHCA
jgi:hypothetical protein